MFYTISELVHSYENIDNQIDELETLKKTNKIKKEIEQLRQQLLEIKFRLELPYKLLELIAEAYKENIEVYLTNIDNDLKIKLRADRYNNAEFYLNELNTTNYYELESVVNVAKERRLKEKYKQQIKQTALSKLTEEEIEVLGLN